MTKDLSDADLHAVMLEAIEEGLNINVHAICVRLQIDVCSLLNQVAIAVAEGFISNTQDFEFCDEIMNALFVAIVDVSMHAPMPEPAFSIYRAFDTGEYTHSGDSTDVCPWEKYTRPEIERILHSTGRGLPTLAS
ncbi:MULTISPECIES: hypothetical protein [Pseudomonas]|uniref:hypothetical protein n=1 Tax=Pseudomonas TaxID=286 RepID=UPI00069EC508|nr:MULTISPECIES: hypothetical protein [Pseudomonas]PJH88315.1 hypothetical protein CVG87_15265 [Pseudomonas sp. WCS365]UII17798.1 hypothetical protein LRP86_04719 [Pseudomonas brassicacearum]